VKTKSVVDDFKQVQSFFSSLSFLPKTINFPGQTAGALEFGEGDSQQHVKFEQFLAGKWL